jgi:hypothetical protein
MNSARRFSGRSRTTPLLPPHGQVMDGRSSQIRSPSGCFVERLWSSRVFFILGVGEGTADRANKRQRANA